MLVPLQHHAVDATGRLHVRGVDQWGAPGSGYHLQQRGGTPSGLAPADLVAVIREAFEVLLGEAAASQQGLLGGGSGADGMISLAGGGGQGMYGVGGASMRRGGGGGSSDPTAFLEGLPSVKLLELLEDEAELKKAAASWLTDTSVRTPRNGSRRTLGCREVCV